VIVIHSFDGLDNDVKDLTRQFAQQGFIAFAPDLASRMSTAEGPQARATILHLDPDQTVRDTMRAYQLIAKDADVDATKIAVVGLGWGSWRAMMLAERVSDLNRVVVYYGSIPTEGLEGIQSPVLAHFAQNDFRDTGNAVWVQATMTKAGAKFSYVVYSDADTEFMSRKNTPANSDAARQSWKKTLEFLRSGS
jgi:carboxymethylenebutenolidase